MPSQHSFQLKISLILIALAFCNNAAAQNSANDEPIIVITAQNEGNQMRKESNIQKLVISEKEIERYGDATVGDVLRHLPGMVMTGPAGVSKDVRLRGLDKGYTNILINGEAVATATKERQIQVDRFPADMIESIEIIRSPSAKYESNGVAGTINIKLKQNADGSTRLRASAGSNGQMTVGDAVVQHSFTLGNTDVLLAASYTAGTENVIENKDILNKTGGVTQNEYKPNPSKRPRFYLHHASFGEQIATTH